MYSGETTLPGLLSSAGDAKRSGVNIGAYRILPMLMSLWITRRSLSKNRWTNKNKSARAFKLYHARIDNHTCKDIVHPFEKVQY